MLAKICVYLFTGCKAFKAMSILFWLIGGVSVLLLISALAFLGFSIFMREVFGVGNL